FAARLEPAHRLRRDQPGGLPGRYRLRLSLQLERLERRVLDRLPGRTIGRLADGDAPGPSGCLKACGDVYGVADDGVAVSDRSGDDVACVDADAQREAHVVTG